MESSSGQAVALVSAGVIAAGVGSNLLRKYLPETIRASSALAADAVDVAVRAVTHFIVMPSEATKWDTVLLSAANFCASVAKRFQDAGYTVQTLRIVTNPFGEYLNTSSEAAAVADMKRIESILQSQQTKLGTRIRFAIGEARTVEEVELVPALVKAAADLANCCVNIPEGACGMPDPVMVAAAARCCATLATQTPDGPGHTIGEGNFNFTANFNMPAGCPYFPAAYNTSAEGASFGIGLEYPDLLVAALQPLPSTASWGAKFDALRAAVAPHMAALDAICQAAAAASSVRYAGIDTSAAPSKDAESLTTVCKLLGLSHFGAAGTLGVAQFLTRLFKSFGKAQGGELDLLGFSGFMLACLEDAGLAKAAAANQFDITALNSYSAVCGIGLDTVPVPGDTPIGKLEALMSDTGAMAFRLSKPLTVRLFPCPGLKAGEMTRFTSSDLCNCTVFAVP